METASTKRLLAASSKPPREAFRRPNGRASFPRRVTLDLDDERYDWCKDQAWEARVPGGIAGLLRAAIDVVSADEQLVRRVLAVADDAHGKGEM